MNQEVSIAQAVEESLHHIERNSHDVNACITATPELAHADAARAQAARDSGRPLPLDGMTIVVKDNIDVGGVRTTRGSAWFADRIASEDAHTVRRLRAAGGIIVGKANMHEFAYGGTSNNTHFGPVRNPWDPDRIPGGSSGGSGAAVAAGWARAALGTDTGGSVRCPAALCGVTGLRPTFGVVSNRGVFPIGPSFDTVGPLARLATEVARLFAVISGGDTLDPDNEPYLGTAGFWQAMPQMSELRIGVPSEYFFEDIDQSVACAANTAIRTFTDLGATLTMIDVPGAARANEVATLIIRAEALSIHHTRLAEHPERFGEDVARRLTMGEELSGWEVAGLYRELRQLRSRLGTVFADVDVVMTPTVPHTATKIDESEMISTTASETRFTYPWSAAHVPAISIPCGFSSEGLPIGLQIVGRPHSEGLLCSMAAAYQELTDWHLQEPATARN